MMAATLLDPDNPPFDRVQVKVDGVTTVFTYREFMNLKLGRRIELILSGEPEFRLGDHLVEKRQALSLVRPREAS
jgi:hypothetical protein